MLCAAASAATENFYGLLNGAGENPDVATGATGFGTAMYDSVLNTLKVDLSFSGLSSPSNNAHIHCCAAPNNTAGVAIDFPSVGFPLAVTAGSFSHTFDLGLDATYNNGYRTASGGTAAGARDRLLNSMRGLAIGNSGIAYFNIHTTMFGGGEIRGDIKPVPEPASLLLMLCGIASLALWRRPRA
jgi:hypothetical protein